jgi:3-oxoacyl-[acyl-carrier protein] reductase
MPLHGKIILIPGASRPIGRAIARKFGAQGAFLILPVFDWPDSIAEMTEEFTAIGFDYWSIESDLRGEKEVVQLAEVIKDRFEAVDFLINNIERGGMPVVHGGYDLAHNHEQWNLELDTTLKAKWLLFQHIYPLMQQRPGGAVVNISSIAAIIGRSGPAAAFFSDGYSAANSAIRVLTETWARQAAPNVRVNELMLGLIRSRHGEGTRGWAALSEQQKAEILDGVLLERTGSPEEVADAVYFLAVEATYFSGATLRMDGGFVSGGNKVPPIPDGIL